MGTFFSSITAAFILLALSITPSAALAQSGAAASSAPTLADFGRLPDFQDMALSDDGKRIAMLVKVEGQRVVLVKQDGKYTQRVTVGDAKVRDLSWAGNSHLLISSSTTLDLFNFNVDQAEFYQTLVVPMDGSEMWTVFAKQREILASTFGIYGTRIIGGRPYLFAGGVKLEKEVTPQETIYRYVGGKSSLYRIDLTDRSVDLVDRAPRDDTYRTWLLDGQGEVGASMDLDRSSGKYKLRRKGGDIITEGQTENGYIRLIAFGRNGDSFIFRQLDDEDEYRRYFEVPASGGSPQEIFTDVDLDGIYLNPANNRIAGYFTEESGGDASIKRMFFDPAIDKKVGLIAGSFPSLRTSIRSSSDNYGSVIVRTNGNGDSGSWFVVNLDERSADVLGYERTKISPEFVGKVRTITYAAQDGLEIDAILTLPPGKEPIQLPVIVLPHGGPTSEDTPGFDWWAQAIASRGYAVLQPNFRGSTNRDRAFVRAGHGEWGRKMQTDLSDGLAYLAGEGIADPKRACIMGASYGGYAALAGVTLQQGIYRCAVSVAGVADLSRMISTDLREAGNDPMIKRNLELQVGKGRDLREVSPRRFADRADAPILLIHGKDDVVVPYKQSFDMADALKDAGKPYELVTLDGEDHWLSREETRLKMLVAAVDFIEQHNPPD